MSGSSIARTRKGMDDAWFQAFRRRRGLPYVLVNMAMTADGKIATANRAIASFSSRRDRENLLRLRATADAVMAGARTIDQGRVILGPGSAKHRRLRLSRGLAEYNLRVIVSGSGSVDPSSKIFQKRFSPIIILTTGRAGGPRLKRLRRLADEVKICGRREIDFPRALRWLQSKWKVRRLVCEGGGELNSPLFRKGLVNELHLTVCPKIAGGRKAPTIVDGAAAPNLAKAARLEIKSSRRICAELFLVYRARASAHRARSQSRSESRFK